MWALFGMLVDQALGNHVGCGDVITQDTTLDSDLSACPGDGIVIGASDITLDLGGHTVSVRALQTETGVRRHGVSRRRSRIRGNGRGRLRLFARDRGYAAVAAPS
jgi:hypothetical protein